MAVYVDEITKWTTKPPFHNGSCHLTADTLDELHAFAERLGMKRRWFHNARNCPHYDLVPSRREKAVALGAIEETNRAGALRRRAARATLAGQL